MSDAGAEAWTHWHSTMGSFTAGWVGYASGPSYGRFDCAGTSRRDGGAVETCTHHADRHAGQIVVRFTVRAVDPPFLVPWRKIGHISLGERLSAVEGHYGFPGDEYHVLSRSNGILRGYYRLYGTRVYVTFEDGLVNAIAFSTPYYRTRSGFGVGSKMPSGQTWHGFVYRLPCTCWVKTGDGARVIYTKHGRVTSFSFVLKFVD